MRFVYTIGVIGLLFACEKNDISLKRGEGYPSFSQDLWEFTNVRFEKLDNGFIYIFLEHYNDTNGLIDNIDIINVPLRSDSIEIVYNMEGHNPVSSTSTAYYYILVGEDALGESYVIDSTKKSYILLDCISNNNISGSFQLYFTLSNTSSLPKFAPYIPDSFSINSGNFNAKKN